MDRHLHHNEPKLAGNTFLSDVVIGISDGLTIPFALAAGLSGTGSSTKIIVIAGIAATAAGAVAMALGGYFSGKTEQDHHANEGKQQHHDANLLVQPGIEETKAFFASLGLSEELQEQATMEVAKDKDKWAELMMKHEAGMEKPDPAQPAKSAMNIGLSYVVGGLVPLSPYFFVDDPMTGLKFSATVTLLCLFAFGWLKSKISGVHPFWEAVRVSTIGALAGAAAFGVAKIFEG